MLSILLNKPHFINSMQSDAQPSAPNITYYNILNLAIKSYHCNATQFYCLLSTHSIIYVRRHLY